MPITRNRSPVFNSAFRSPDDEFQGKRPVIFDVLAPDMQTSILPPNLCLVLHVNPSAMNFTYEKTIERIQTKGGFVEQHWGDGSCTISFEMVTGGFMRLYSGLSNITGGLGAIDVGGTRRETLAYDKYLDLLALFHNNGCIYDAKGQIVFNGFIKITFDGGSYIGWFSEFGVTESVDQPYMFQLTAGFVIHEEVQRLRTLPYKHSWGAV